MTLNAWPERIDDPDQVPASAPYRWPVLAWAMEAVFEGPGEYDAPTVLVWPVLVDGIYTGGHQEAILYPNGHVEVVENTSYDSEQQWLQAVCRESLRP